jgi:glycopeptide antibiotics resistance protein
MKKLTLIQVAMYHILFIGVVFLILKLFKAVTFGWIVTLSPFLTLIFIELVFYIWGYIIYRKIKRKNG